MRGSNLSISIQLKFDRLTPPTYHRLVQTVISAEQMREVDRLTSERHNIPSLQLMQNAAEACFEVVADHFLQNLKNKRSLILCGPGNNGGDGAALAQLLAAAGVHTDVVLLARVAETRGDAHTNFQKVKRLASAADSGLEGMLVLSEINEDFDPAELSQNYDLIVDALFGTGLKRPLEGKFLRAIEYLKSVRKSRERSMSALPLLLSIDIPSGLKADSPEPIGESVQADVTVTFTAPKAANVLPPASDSNGKLIVADIGSPVSLVEGCNSELFVSDERDVRDWLVSTRYTPGSFKNTHGHVLVIAGSRGYTGAAVLCGNSSMRSGAGLVTIASPASSQLAIASNAMPEVMTIALAETDRGAVSDEAVDHVLCMAAKATVVAIGPGLTSEDERTRRFVYSIIKQRRTPIVIDADALNCLSKHSGSGWPPDLQGSEEAPMILTPHPGEMLRLMGTEHKSALTDRVAAAREFAAKHNVILVLKGSRSLVATPDGKVFVNPTGNPGLGTAGAGDTLTGLIAGFVAQATDQKYENVVRATISALYVGGLAGDFAARDLGMRSMVASDIQEYFSEAIRSIDPVGEMPINNSYL